MTENEAIKFLKGMQNKKVDYGEMVGAPPSCYGYEFVYPEPEDYAIVEAIKALEEVQEYRKIGTVEECREAVEKTKAKKPMFYSTNWYCPKCENLVGNSTFHWLHDFCKNCGQKIDWSEE